MTTEQVTEGNILIAKFMGGRPHFVHMGPGAEERILIPVWGDRSLRISSPEAWPDLRDEMYYHESWEWLMPCVGRINETCAGGICSDVHDHLLRADIEKTYEAVVEFIKWYNNSPIKPRPGKA
jgi:hypothetical protein